MNVCMQLLRLSWMADLQCWYAGLSLPIAIMTCAANRQTPCFPAVTVLMESLPSEEQHLHASLQWPSTKLGSSIGSSSRVPYCCQVHK